MKHKDGTCSGNARRVACNVSLKLKYFSKNHSLRLEHEHETFWLESQEQIAFLSPHSETGKKKTRAFHSQSTIKMLFNKNAMFEVEAATASHVDKQLD